MAWKIASPRQRAAPTAGSAAGRGWPERMRASIAAQWTIANEIRKMRLDAAPAEATFPTATAISVIIPPVATTATAGVPVRPRISPMWCGSVRSRAIENATREAPNRFACSADSIDRSPAPMTNQ